MHSIVYLSHRYGYGRQEKYLIQYLEQISDSVEIIKSDLLECNIETDFPKCKVRFGTYRNRLQAYAAVLLEQQEDKETLFCDNSFYGPLITEEKFDKRQSWAIWRCKDHYSGMDYKRIAGHLDTSLMFVKDDALKKMKAIMQNHKELEEHDELSAEILFTQLSESEGTNWNLHINTDSLDSEYTVNNVDWLVELPYTMVKEYHSPIVKKDCFKENNYAYTDKNELSSAIRYIDKNYEYDTDFIWDDILQRNNIADVIDTMQLTSVISDMPVEIDKSIYEDCAVIFHITYEHLVDAAMEYIKNIPEEIDLYITFKGDMCGRALKNALSTIGKKNFEMRRACERGRDFAALLITCKDVLEKYKYICFAHNNKTRNDVGPYMIGRTYMQEWVGDVLGSRNQIDQILKLLTENRRLGLLIPPVCYSGGVFNSLNAPWFAEYEITKQLGRRLGLNVEIAKDKYVYGQGSTFWCKKDALKKFFAAGWQEDDFPQEPVRVHSEISHAMERIFTYVAQDAGFYTEIIETEDSARKRISNYRVILREMCNDVSIYTSAYYQNFRRNMRETALQEFCSIHNEIYIFGHGVLAGTARKLADKLHCNIQGYVLSDGKEIPEDDDLILHLSDLVAKKENIGIIVALGGYFQREIIPALREQGFHNLYVI